ncbi:MAG: hypothetical protein LBV23_04735, partial [Deltaproteobacteria bacterium]|nr:hypothetical protein [Deltaproteobacteria bacterium]
AIGKLAFNLVRPLTNKWPDESTESIVNLMKTCMPFLLAILSEKLRDIAYPKEWRLINGRERLAIFVPVKVV